MNEIEMLQTHSLKKIQHMYQYDRVLTAVEWVLIVAFIAIGCYWIAGQ